MARRSEDRRVTVLMAVYNGGEHLPAAVGSILTQTFNDFELLVVDDGSTDGSSEFLRRLDDRRVRVIRQENQGLVAALNRGLAETRTELVARMDADDVSAPTRLERQVRFLDENPRVAAVGCCYEVIDESGRVQDVVHVAAEPGYLHRRLYFRNTFAHASMMFRLSAVLEAGKYRDVGPVEDYDLWIRLAARDDLAGLPDTLFAYRLTRGGVSVSAVQRQRDCHATVRDQFHRARPMVSLSAWAVFAEGRTHRRKYSGTCSRPLAEYVFDHAWLALLAAKRGRLHHATQLALGIAMLLLRHPATTRGLPTVASFPTRANRRDSNADRSG